MVTYWLTSKLCISCYQFADTKVHSYASDEEIKRFETELENMQDRIISDLKNEPSNGWPGLEYETSFPIGLVKVLISKKRPDKKEPYITKYQLRCYFCGFKIDEENYRKLMGIEDSVVGTKDEEKLDQVSLDNFV